MRLRGELTYLRSLTAADVSLWIGWLRDATRRRYLPYDRAPSLRAEVRRFREYRRRGDRRFLIVERVGNMPVGVIALSPIDKTNKCAEVFIMLGKREFEGRGLATDALRVLLRYAFQELGLNRIELAVREDNRRALRVYTGVGFRLEGRRAESTCKDGRFYDVFLMSILRADYLRRSAARAA